MLEFFHKIEKRLLNAFRVVNVKKTAVKNGIKKKKKKVRFSYILF